MKKLFLIGWKDLTLAFRDRAALILMLLAPFALTIGLGFVTGNFSSTSNSGISSIPVVLVNQDEGMLGEELVALFQSQDLADLVAPTIRVDAQTARQQVNDDQAAAAVIIPAGFSASILPNSQTGETQPAQQIEIFSNPTRPTTAGVIQAIVEQFVQQVEVGRVSGKVAVTQLIQSGLIAPQDAAKVGSEIGIAQAQTVSNSQAIALKGSIESAPPIEFNPLAYMAPGMALMFLMFTVSNGGRTLLAENIHGTLPRLLAAPVTTTQVLGGKLLGIYLTGVVQMLILILGSTLLFRLQWGDPPAVLVLVLVAVWGAVGWGMVITSLAKTPAQVSNIGSAMMLIFGILGGSFLTWIRFQAGFAS